MTTLPPPPPCTAFSDVWQVFESNCQTYSERVATHFEGADQSYGQLKLRSLRLAGWLRYRFQIQSGDVLAIISLNRPEILEAFFAAARLGCMVTVLNTRLVRDEMTQIITASGAKVLLAEPRFADHVSNIDTSVISLSAEQWPTDDGREVVRFEDLVTTDCPTDPPPHESSPDAPLLLQFTSGSTGTPKAALISQRNLVWDAIGQSQHMRLANGDRQLLATPMSWTAGLVLVTQASLLNGLPIHILPSWSVDGAIDAITSGGCNVIGTFPLIVRELMDGIERRVDFPAASLRVLVCGGGVHTAEFDERVMKLLNPVSYIFIYGMTETTGPAVYTRETSVTLSKELGVGYPAWYLEHRIIGEDGLDVEKGEPGELLLRGPTVIPGYFDAPELNESTFAGGWLHTGDVMREDVDGCLFFVDRVKDVVKSGGINVYAAEVEQRIIHRYGEVVSDVAVVGVPSKRWGEAVVAVVRLSGDSSLDETAFLAGLRTTMADYKVPKRVLFVTDVIRTSTGKVDKPKLRVAVREVVHDL